MTDSTPSGKSSASSRRRRISLAIGTTGLAVAVVAGVSACGSSGSSNSAAASSTSAAASSSAKPGHGKHHGHGVFGTIASENANTWTLTKKDGSTETVTITPQTTFGSKKNPAQQSQFTVGETVVVRGKESGTTITATAIMQAKAHQGSTTPSASGAPAPTTN